MIQNEKWFTAIEAIRRLKSAYEAIRRVIHVQNWLIKELCRGTSVVCIFTLHEPVEGVASRDEKLVGFGTGTLQAYANEIPHPLYDHKVLCFCI